MRRRCPLPPHGSSAATARSHPARRGRNRLDGRRVCRLSSRELARNRSAARSGRDFVIVAAPPQVDEIGVVRILKYSREVSLAQAFAVATEKRARRGANKTGGCSGVTADERSDSTTNEIECFLARESQAGCANLTRRG